MGNDILQAIPTLEKDIPADQFLVQEFWIPLAWGCAILIPLAVLAAWWLYRRRPRTANPGTSPLLEAQAALQELEARMPSLRECSLRLSLILRSYLAGQTQDPALYETHEEFSQRMDSLSRVPLSCQLETRDLLEQLAEFKYAGEAADNAVRAHAMLESTRDLIARIDRAQQEEQNSKEGAA